LCSLLVSGSEIMGLLKGHTIGSVWLSGGGFGIEASMVTLVFSVMTAGTLFYFAGQRGRFIARHSAAHEIRTKKAAVA